MNYHDHCEDLLDSLLVLATQALAWGAIFACVSASITSEHLQVTGLPLLMLLASIASARSIGDFWANRDTYGATNMYDSIIHHPWRFVSPAWQAKAFKHTFRAYSPYSLASSLQTLTIGRIGAGVLGLFVTAGALGGGYITADGPDDEVAPVAAQVLDNLTSSPYAPPVAYHCDGTTATFEEGQTAWWTAKEKIKQGVLGTNLTTTQDGNRASVTWNEGFSTPSTGTITLVNVDGTWYPCDKIIETTEEIPGSPQKVS